MKRIVLFIVFAVVFAVILCDFCVADEIDTRAIENSLSDDVKQLAGEVENASDFNSFIDRLGKTIINSLSDNLSSVTNKAVSLVIIIFLCAVIEIFGNGENTKYVTICACAAITIVCISDVNSYLSLGNKTITQLSDFSKLLLPALCTASATCGAVSSAAVRYASSALFIDVFISIAENVIVPVIYAFIATSIAASAFENKALRSVSKLLKWLSTSLMVLFSLAFTVYLSVSTSIASSSDAAASKLLKTTISIVLPVVGSIISDAASSVVAGAELIKNTIGAFGMIAVLSICISPLLVIGLNYLMFKAAAAFSVMLSSPGISEAINSISCALGMIFGVIGCCAIMLFISVLSCIRAVMG